MMLVGILFSLTFCLVSINGHGYLLNPPARSSAWRFDSAFQQCCTEYTDNEMYCGGKVRQYKVNGGKCGICGEAYDRPKLFERGGSKYLGKIVRTYTKGQQVGVTVKLTQNHKGYFEYRLCSLDHTPNSDATQNCLDRTLLRIVSTGQTRTADVGSEGSKDITIRVQLPKDLTCRHCVLQWKYTAANDWGTDPITGESGPGKGVENETFMGCADIAIVANR